LLRIASLVLAAALLAFSVPATAQNTRSYVSANLGSDTNSCTRLNPCATFNGALAKTQTGGFVSCAEPGYFGTLTVTFSVTIDCPEGFGMTGIVTVNIPVNASDPQRTAILRGITIQGSSLNNIGVDIAAGTTVVLENVRISDFTVQGIKDHRTGGGTQLIVRNSSVANISGVGILLVAGATGNVVLDNVLVTRSTYGLAAAAGNNVTINRSTLSGNSVAGVIGDTGAQVVVNNSTISHNNYGVQSNQSVRLSNNDIAFNATAVFGSSGTFGNNRFSGNGTIGTAPAALGSASSDLGQQ
jgi:hypothetical protein